MVTVWSKVKKKTESEFCLYKLSSNHAFARSFRDHISNKRPRQKYSRDTFLLSNTSYCLTKSYTSLVLLKCPILLYPFAYYPFPIQLYS